MNEGRSDPSELIKNKEDSLALTPTKSKEQRDSESPAQKDSNLVRIAARREVVLHLYRRGLGASDIVKHLLAKTDHLNGVKAPYFLVRRDIRFALARARRLKDDGNHERAQKESEAEYLGKLEELYSIAVSERDVGAARQVLHDWARAHGIEVDAVVPINVNFQQNNIQQNTVAVIQDGSDSEAAENAIRKQLALIGAKVAGLVGSSGIPQDSTRTDEPA